MRFPFALLLTCLVSACYHPLEIVGQGDIVSSTGTRNCSFEEQPCENMVEGEYSVTYTAVPRDGWTFVGWENCGHQFPQCTFDLSQEVVEQFPELSVPLRAIFEPLPFSQPNILTIMVDDFGYNDLAINNNSTDTATPNMDQLAREGVRFTRHYATAVCSPARAALLTGINPSRLGYIPNGPGISPDIDTLPDLLGSLGYQSWHIGKWHIGYEYRDAWPDRQGFDHWFGFLSQWRLAGEHVDGELVLAAPRYDDPWLEGDLDAGQHYTGHLDDLLADRALDVLTELESTVEPWYLNLWFYAPHDPIDPSAEFASRYPDTYEGRYQALVEQVDHNIGRVIQRLEDLGALDDTIVVVVSDNGGANLNGTLESNAPYYGYKRSLHEGALRVPLLIRWPGQKFSGATYDDIVSIEDLYPTLLEAIGVAVPPDIDGVSFFSAMGTRPLPNSRNLFWEFSPFDKSHAVLSVDGLWKRYQGGRLWGVNPPPVLFDLATDPTGSAADPMPPPDRVQQLADIFHNWYRDAHTVGYDLIDTGGGVRQLSGHSLQRTPGVGAYTFGIALDGLYEGQVVAQQDVWRIDKSAATVTVTIGAYTLQGTVDNPGACNSVVLSGFFYRKLNHIQPAPHIDLTLYIDGQEKERLQVSGSALSSTPANVTVVGDPLGTDNEMIGNPVILNRWLTDESEWTVDAFSNELCSPAS